MREMMQNAVNESFWDAHGVEIGPCAFFEHFARSDKICPEGNFFVDSMLGEGLVKHRSQPKTVGAGLLDRPTGDQKAAS